MGSVSGGLGVGLIMGEASRVVELPPFAANEGGGGCTRVSRPGL